MKGKSKHGGARPGAGAPKKPPEQKIVQDWVFIPKHISDSLSHEEKREAILTAFRKKIHENNSNRA